MRAKPTKGGVGQEKHAAKGRSGHLDPETGEDPFRDVRAPRGARGP